MIMARHNGKTGTALRYLAAAGLLIGAAVTLGGPAFAAKLKPETLAAWEVYRQLTEARIAAELDSDKGFLIQDFLPPSDRERCRRTLDSGAVFVHKMTTRDEEGREVRIPKGMVHHWMGSVVVPDATLNDLLAWVQNYDEHEKYFMEVIKSRLLSRDGDRFMIYLKLKRTKILTVYYNTEHRVEYRRHGPHRVSSTSHAVKIAELENAETDNERELPPGQDRGFLWRLDSYWRFQQKGDGVVVECESTSLSRSIPPVLSLVIKGYVRAVARESLENTLAAIRDRFHETGARPSVGPAAAATASATPGSTATPAPRTEDPGPQ